MAHVRAARPSLFLPLAGVRSFLFRSSRLVLLLAALLLISRRPCLGSFRCLSLLRAAPRGPPRLSPFSLPAGVLPFAGLCSAIPPSLALLRPCFSSSARSSCPFFVRAPALLAVASCCCLPSVCPPGLPSPCHASALSFLRPVFGCSASSFPPPPPSFGPLSVLSPLGSLVAQRSFVLLVAADAVRSLCMTPCMSPCAPLSSWIVVPTRARAAFGLAKKCACVCLCVRVCAHV